MVIYSGFSNENLWFSIVMLVYQKVPSVSPAEDKVSVVKYMENTNQWNEELTG